MKVLIISEYFYPESRGGGEISAFLLAKELAKSGLEIHVLTSYFNGLKRYEKIKGVIIHRKLKNGKDPVSILDNLKRNLFFEKSLLKELEKLDQKEKYDIIHCMNISSISAVKLKDKLNKKFILHVNSPVLFCPKGTLMYKDEEICERTCTRTTFLDCYLNSNLIGKINLKPYIKYNPLAIYFIRKKYEIYQELLKNFDFYMPISNYMKKRLLKEGIDENKVSVIYNIVELDKFFKLKQPNNKVPKILYLGEYSKPKGPQLLIEALKHIKEPYEANFYGSGVLKDFLKKETRENNLKVNINDKVLYDKVPEIMQKHDIVVFPSLVAEAFGRVVLEAVAAGKTVIASDVGGLRDIVEEGKTGWLFEAGCGEKLRKLINKTLERKLNYKRIKKIIKEKFLIEKASSKTIRVYKKHMK